MSACTRPPQGMGMAKLTCDGVCSCRETLINALYTPNHVSVPQLHEFKMYRAAAGNSSAPQPQVCKLKASACGDHGCWWHALISFQACTHRFSGLAVCSG